VYRRFLGRRDEAAWLRFCAPRKLHTKRCWIELAKNRGAGCDQALAIKRTGFWIGRPKNGSCSGVGQVSYRRSRGSGGHMIWRTAGEVSIWGARNNKWKRIGRTRRRSKNKLLSIRIKKNLKNDDGRNKKKREYVRLQSMGNTQRENLRTNVQILTREASTIRHENLQPR